MITYFFKWLKWLIKNKPMIGYDGYNCGCCGTWIEKEIEVPIYKSGGYWWDTFGICNKCNKENNK